MAAPKGKIPEHVQQKQKRICNSGANHPFLVIRNRVGARNLAVIRKIALNSLLKEDSLKKGIATKQCAAACDPAYSWR